MSYLNDLQSKRKTKKDQGEEFGLVFCMTAQIMTAIIIMHVALNVELNEIKNASKRPLDGCPLF